MITYDRVKALFDYDPVTGELWRKADGSQGRHSGRAGNETFKLDRNGVKQPVRRIVHVDGVRYPEAKIIWLWMMGNWPTAKFIDHIDCNPFNNAWVNLREADDQNSLRNRRSWTATGYKWVYVDNRKEKSRYGARVRIDGKDHHIGKFSTPQEAHAAAYAFIQKIYGSFSRK